MSYSHHCWCLGRLGTKTFRTTISQVDIHLASWRLDGCLFVGNQFCSFWIPVDPVALESTLGTVFFILLFFR
jgi:hypothetical protein